MKYIEISNFFTPQECQQLIDICKDKMVPAMSPDPANNFKPIKSIQQCNNWVTYLRPGDHPVVEQITRKMEAYTGRSRLYYEPIQVLRYDVGQYYRFHVDNSYPQDPNPRKATFQVYLNTVEEGGETHFVKLGLKFKPVQGNAVYWYNFGTERDMEEKPSAELNTEHEGMTIIKGVKYSLTQWIKLWPVGLTSRPQALVPQVMKS